jgi:hypothetical protein
VELAITRLYRCAIANRRRERGELENCELVWRITASTSAVTTVRIRRFRAMMVFSAERVCGTRCHAHRCVRRSRTMHGAWRLNEEKSAVQREPESDKRTQHTSSDRAAHHAKKVSLGIGRVQMTATCS